MNGSGQRSEPRFTLGERIQVALNRGAVWLELPGMTVNVSENGVLVSIAEVPEVGEVVRIRTPADEKWAEAVVRHLVRGTANCLVGLRLRQQPQAWFVPRG